MTIWLARRRDKRNPAPGLERLWAATVWSQPVALATTALVTAAALGGVSKQGLIMMWAVVTLILLFSALRIEAAALSLWLKRASGVLLIGTALVHLLRFLPADPVILSVDIGLMVCGGVLLWLARGAVLRPVPAVSR